MRLSATRLNVISSGIGPSSPNVPSDYVIVLLPDSRQVFLPDGRAVVMTNEQISNGFNVAQIFLNNGENIAILS